jgi:hypothetical protein
MKKFKSPLEIVDKPSLQALEEQYRKNRLGPTCPVREHRILFNLLIAGLTDLFLHITKVLFREYD